MTFFEGSVILPLFIDILDFLAADFSRHDDAINKERRRQHHSQTVDDNHCTAVRGETTTFLVSDSTYT